MATNALTLLSKARRALTQARSIEQFAELRDQGHAMLKYLRCRRDLSLDIRNEAASIVIECEVAIGRQLAAIQRQQGKRSDRTSSPRETKLSGAISAAGISRPQAHRYQLIASLPDRLRLDITRQLQARGEELTSALIRRAARERLNAQRNRTLAVRPQACTVADLAALSGIRTVYADPPWQYDNRAARGAANNHYPTLTPEEIASLPVRSVAEQDSILYLWTTNAFLIEALTLVIPAWGFEFKTSLVWCKPQMGTGNYVRVSHEFLLLATRGRPRTNGSNQMSWIEAPRTSHSTKPQVFREIVERLSPAPRLELFARSRWPGWFVWGNELDREAIRPLNGAQSRRSSRWRG